MPKYSVYSETPVALDSPDHINPFGIKYNNSHNQQFNDKLYELYPFKPLRILDIGCAGGASVKSFLDQGHYSIGLEGSDYRKVRQMPEWDTIPDNLFLCDVTKRFNIYEDKSLAKFDIITMWEFLEHIHKDDLPKIYDIVKKYLYPGGAWIVSICVFDEERSKRTYGIEWGPKDIFPNTQCGDGIGFHHQWCVPREWWLEELPKQGFKINNEKLEHFNGQFVRGPGIGAGEDCTINLFLEL